MPLDRWHAPDRDSPTTLEFSVTTELGSQLDTLMRSEGSAGTKEDAVRAATGVTLSRPRRWHKIFERMGLLFPDESGLTRLTDLGSALRSTQKTAASEVRRALARKAIFVLRKYQLQNPADNQNPEDEFPADADLHPYWAIWKAAVQLDGKLHWDELNRVLMWVLRHADLDLAIERIQRARLRPDYDPMADGEHSLGPRAYDQDSTTDDRDPSGQVRDQKTTPWFKRAGLGELLLLPGGRSGHGYWTIHPDVRDLLEVETQAPPPEFVSIGTAQDWFAYYGRLEALTSDAAGGESNPTLPYEVDEPLLVDLPDDDPVLQSVRELIAEGSGGVLLSGPPGTSKSWYARRLAGKLVDGDTRRARFAQFHPSMGYDDFVEGYVPIIVDGATSFEVRRKLFLQLCDVATSVAPDLCVMVIDEINRGDVSRIFGELLTYLEPSYRNQSFRLAYSGRATKIPANIFIIGTFNPFDKSVVELDDALDRRFDRISLDPSVHSLRNLLIAQGTPEELLGKTLQYFVELNKMSRHGIGHALFMSIKNDETLRRLWTRKLRFILEKAFRFEPELLTKAKEQYLALFEDRPNAGI